MNNLNYPLLQSPHRSYYCIHITETKTDLQKVSANKIPTALRKTLSPDSDYRGSIQFAFFGLTLAQLWHVFNMSSGKRFRLKNEITKNKYVWFALLICFSIIALLNVVPFLQRLLNLEPLTFDTWMVSTVAGIMPLVIIQMIKIIRK